MENGGATFEAWKKCYRYLGKVIEINPDNIEVRNKCYGYLEKAVEINPDNIEAWSYVNPEKAIELCDERLESNPNDEEVWLNIGRAYMRMSAMEFDFSVVEERKKEAQKCFNKVVELNPKNEVALFYLGVLSIELFIKNEEMEEMEAKPEYASIPNFNIYWEETKKREQNAAYENLRKAFSYFDRCSEINPNNHYYTGLIEGITRMIKTREKLKKKREEKLKKDDSFLQRLVRFVKI